MKRIGKYTLEYSTPPTILVAAAIGGKKEAEGPLADDFDQLFNDTTLNMDSWEKAESQLQKESVSCALSKGHMKAEQIQFVFAGDLLNQCTSSTFGLMDFEIPFLGQYGACSTMAQTLLMASLMVESGAADFTAAVTSSHFCSAERQFRLPLEYGGQRAPTTQWTVTGSGCAIVGKGGPIQIKHVMAGRIVDFKVKNAANMGAAMAPAAATSIYDYLKDTNTKPEDYDRIFTGDLGMIGTDLMHQLLELNEVKIKNNHRDCGLLIFDREKQDVHAGGSGCGCSATVLCGHIVKNMISRKYKDILFVATGALLSPTSQMQGESIPGIAHVVHLSVPS